MTLRRLIVVAALLLASVGALAQQYTTTTHLGLRKPVDGSTNWGDLTNQNWDDLDAYLNDMVAHNAAGALSGYSFWSETPTSQLQTSKGYFKSTTDSEVLIVDSIAGQTADLQTWRRNGEVLADVTSTGAIELVAYDNGAEYGIVFKQTSGAAFGGGGGAMEERKNGAMIFKSGAASNGNQIHDALALGQHIFQYADVTKQWFDAAGLYFNNGQTIYFNNLAGVPKEVLRGATDDATAVAMLGAGGFNIWTPGFGARRASFASDSDSMYLGALADAGISRYDVGKLGARNGTGSAVPFDAGGYSTNGTPGLSVTVTVKGSTGANCDLVFTGGLLTSKTCP